MAESTNHHQENEEFLCDITYEISLPNTSLTQAYDAFSRVVWWGGAVGVVSAGDPRTLQGAVRSVPLGIHEEVLTTSYPNSFEYTLVKKSIFPVSAHRGCVSFIQEEEEEEEEEEEGGDASATRVVWHVRYTPYCCMNWLARGMLAFLPIFLWNFKSTVEAEKSDNSFDKKTE
jgi:hypothetical protein